MACQIISILKQKTSYKIAEGPDDPERFDPSEVFAKTGGKPLRFSSLSLTQDGRETETPSLLLNATQIPRVIALVQPASLENSLSIDSREAGAGLKTGQ